MDRIQYVLRLTTARKDHGIIYLRQLALSLLLTVAAGLARADWRADLDSLVQAQSSSDRERLIGRILKAAPPVNDIAEHLRHITFPEHATDTVIVNDFVCRDGINRPWALYVPPDYTPDRPAPMLVVLHGGATRPELTEDVYAHCRDHYLTALAGQHGWLALFPSGRAGATWWNETGIDIIRRLVRRVKAEYNVDDDRVWPAGFSDGGSGAFFQIMTAPNDYAAFVALNAHPAIGSMAAGIPVSFANLAVAPGYVVTNDNDRLFPTARIDPVIETARRAGATLVYKKHRGGHDLTYGDVELPLIADFLENHRRDRFPDSILWETAAPAFGACRWLAVDSISDTRPVVFDVPDYRLDKNRRPPAMIHAVADGNRITIDAKYVTALRFLIHPDMFDMKTPLVVRLNGATLFEDRVEPDAEFLIRNFLDNRDRRLLYTAEVRIVTP